MIKIIAIFTSICLFSCTGFKKNTVRKYYTEAYSLNFGFDSTSNEYYLRDFDYGISAMIPEFDSISLRNNTIFISGYIINPRNQSGNRMKIDNVNILYAYEQKQRNRITLIDSLGNSTTSGKFDLQIINPKKKFYLLFLKDTLIPCAQIINSKKIKAKM